MITYHFGCSTCNSWPFFFKIVANKVYLQGLHRSGKLVQTGSVSSVFLGFLFHGMVELQLKVQFFLVQSGLSPVFSSSMDWTFNPYEGVNVVNQIFDMLAIVQWSTKLCGFSANAAEGLDSLAYYASSKWLTGDHANQMLDLLRKSLERKRKYNICYDFKRLRQSSTVVGSKVQVLMSLEECKS